MMNTYVILRRGGWRSPEDLQAAAARSTKVGDEEMSDDRAHASRADLPVGEIIPVADTAFVRPRPRAAST